MNIRIRFDEVVTIMVLALALVLVRGAAAAPEISWTPADGLPCYNCVPTDWVLMELPFDHDHEIVTMPDGLEALHVLDWNDTSYSRANIGVFSSPSDDRDAVYEFTGQTVFGVWMSGFHDHDKSMALSLTPDRVGFQIDATTWVVYVEVDTTDTMHTYRVEKHGRDFVRVIMDGETLFQVAYSAMPEEPWPDAGSTYANSGALVRCGVDSEAELYQRSYRHYVGATDFPDDDDDDPMPRVIRPWTLDWAETLAYD